MDCATAKRMIEQRVDGLLPPGSWGELDAHLSSCEECAAGQSRSAAVGPALRSYAGARAASASGGLDAMWTRVRAGIEEERPARQPARRWKWAFLPAAALALGIFGLLFYPSGLDRSPLDPRTFDVSVEDVESDVAVVTLLDMGEDLPRVIWIIEDDLES